MKYRNITFLLGVAFILFSVLPISSVSAFANSNTIYYVDITHPNAADNDRHGTIDQPWKTLPYALQQLKPGATLLIREGTYPGAKLKLDASHSGTPETPILVKAYPGETVIWANPQAERLIFNGASWWTIEDIIFQGQGVQLGEDMNTITRHITIRNCHFRDSSIEAIRIWYVEHILVENCHFQRIQSLQAGADTTAVTIPRYADDVVIRNSRFEDNSADGITLGNNHVSVTNITIENNEFWINNPDQVYLGENGVDIKTVNGPIYVRGNVFHGFRPTVEGQNASGAYGIGLTLHFDARNVIIEQNLFYDNTSHISIIPGKIGTPNLNVNVIIRNNIFKEARKNSRTGSVMGGYALRVEDVSGIQVIHNTFYDNEIFLQSSRASQCIFKNNIIFKGVARLNASGWEADHNIWAQVEEANRATLQASSDLVTANLQLGENLRPQSASPVINNGQYLNVPDDFDGNLRFDGAPDIGPFEYALPSTPTATPTSTSLPTATPAIMPTATPKSPQPTLFSENFETGTLAAWSTIQGNLKDFKLTSNAAWLGTRGLSIAIFDQLPHWLELNKLANLKKAHARFYFNPSKLVMAPGETFTLARLTGKEKAAQVQLNYNYTGYRLRLALYNNSQVWVYSDWVNVSTAWHAVEFNFVTASPANAKNAEGKLWVDGNQIAMVTRINNNQTITEFALGVLNGLDTRTKGQLFSDEIKIATHYIGPETDGPSPLLATADEESVISGPPPIITRPDLNGDGSIDILDLTVIASSFGGNDVRSDLNGDGTVNILDLANVASFYSQPGSETLTLPTPTLLPELPIPTATTLLEPTVPTETPILSLPTPEPPQATETPTPTLPLPTETFTPVAPTPVETATSTPLPTETPMPAPEMPTETPSPAPLPGEPSTPDEAPAP